MSRQKFYPETDEIPPPPAPRRSFLGFLHCCHVASHCKYSNEKRATREEKERSAQFCGMQCTDKEFSGGRNNSFVDLIHSFVHRSVLFALYGGAASHAAVYTISR